MATAEMIQALCAGSVAGGRQLCRVAHTGGMTLLQIGLWAVVFALIGTALLMAGALIGDLRRTRRARRS